MLTDDVSMGRADAYAHERRLVYGAPIRFGGAHSAAREDGFAGDWHLVHLGSPAVGGAGLVFTEATGVEARGRISPEDLGLWKDEHVPALQRIARFARAHGAATGVQLAHAGRKASTARPWDGGQPVDPPRGWQPIVGPSPLLFDDGYQTPEPLTPAGITSIIDAFGEAALRALHAEFDVVEIHAAHGYLVHEFLSPISNRRDDLWGGTFDNRIRLLLEIVRAVRRHWPDQRPLFVRLSTTDWLGADGWDVEDSIALARRLRSEGVDVIYWPMRRTDRSWLPGDGERAPARASSG